MTRKPGELETVVSLIFCCSVLMMRYAVGILPNICVCDLTSKLAGHNHKRYLNSPLGINSSSKHFGTNLFNRTPLAWRAVGGVVFELSMN